MPDRSQDSEQSEEESETGHSPEGQVSPIPEPTFSVNVKKTRQPADKEQAEAPERLPFELELMKVSSEQITPLKLKAGLREDWKVRPPNIEGGRILDEFEREVTTPQMKIWGSARIQPKTPLLEYAESAEINLPPRPLLSVESLERDAEHSGDVDMVGEDTDDASLQKENEETEPTSSADSGAEAQPDSGGTESPPDLYEMLFRIPDGEIASREPLCIVAAKREGDRYKQTLETLCREQFRQYQSGKPLADLLPESEAGQIEDARIENRIISYDDSDSDFFDFAARLDDEITRELLEDESEVEMESLYTTIDQFFSNTLGYLILFVEERYADVLYEHLRSVEEIRESNSIISIHLRQLPDDVKRELVRLTWGNVRVDTDKRDLDSLFHTAEDNFSDAIEPAGSIEDLTNPDAEGTESRLHFWVKCFVVDFLLSRHGLKPVEQHNRPELMDTIKTEEQPWDNNDLRPDVYDTNTGEAYEVETLYGTNHKKIDQTIDRYEGTNIKQINIVLPNLTCLRNLDDVLRKTQEESGEMYRNDVEFWTLNLENGELLPIDDVTATLTQLHERCEHLL